MGAFRTSWVRDFPVGNADDIRRYAAARGDMNSLHHDEERAKKNELLGIIAPGMLAIEHTAASIGNEMDGVMVHKLTMEFKNPLYAGSLPSVLCTIVRQRRISADVNIKIHNGYELVAVGSCELLLPRW